MLCMRSEAVQLTQCCNGMCAFPSTGAPVSQLYTIYHFDPFLHFPIHNSHEIDSSSIGTLVCVCARLCIECNNILFLYALVQSAENFSADYEQIEKPIWGSNTTHNIFIGNILELINRVEKNIIILRASGRIVCMCGEEFSWGSGIR